MPNEISLRLTRASLSIALVASVLCAGFDPASAQTVKKNSDGTVEAYDEGDSAQSESVDVGGGGGDNNTMQKGYRAGTSPYQKKFSDGTTVKRNSDGTIETWDEGETHHYSGGIPVNSSSTHRKTTRHSTKSSKGKTTAKVTTSTVKKKTK